MRTIQELSHGWLFSKTCEAAPDRLPQGEGWQIVSLPHCWNAVDGQDGSPFERGAFWYVTEFEAPRQPLPGGRVYIEVGAASLVGEVWVNGRFQCRHVGGFSLFRADVTEACHGGKNTLAILCDNRPSDHVYPQRADFTFYGGLYRWVKVISAPASRFSLDHYGSDGVFVDARPLENGAAQIDIRALLTKEQERQTVSARVFDGDGRQVGEVWTPASPETRLSLRLPQAKLWDGAEKAHIYRAVLDLVQYNEVLDEVEVTFGVRAFEVDSQRGYILNGRDYPLRGVCRHQDRLYEGNALTRREHFEDARIIADMGANCIRLAHYQQSSDIYDACDQLGLVVWAEIPYFTRTWSDEGHGYAVNEMKELCAQNYNHPSICFWGLSNEILMGNNDNPKLLDCHRDLADAVHEIDSTRLTVVAHEYTHGWDHGLHDVSDVEGWNHYFGWYRGEAADLGKWLDEYHEKYPERRVAVSEYGCDAVVSYHSQNPVKMDYTEEYQALLHEKALEDFASRPWVWGTFVWNMFDFGSGFRREGGTRGRNNKGLVTLDRKVCKDSYYVYKAWFSKRPFVHIDGRRFYARPEAQTAILVRSNQPEVSLYVDGKLFATLSGDKKFVFSQVPLSPEGTTITARAGDEEDSISLRQVSAMPEEFTFPGFKEAMDATNWFVSVEEAVGTLEAKPGFFSVHDKMKTLLANKEASRVLMNCLLATAQRSLPEAMLSSGDPEQTVAEFCSQGFVGVMLGDKQESTIRRIHSALLKVSK